jgi:hypothetical protein
LPSGKAGHVNGHLLTFQTAGDPDHRHNDLCILRGGDCRRVRMVQREI